MPFHKKYYASPCQLISYNYNKKYKEENRKRIREYTNRGAEMPRRSKGPRYYASKNAWYANIRGEAVKLIEVPEKATKQEKKEAEEEAQRRYDKLAQARAAEVEGDRSETWAILNAYLANARTRSVPPPLAPNTYRIHDKAIQDFCGFEYEPGKTCGKLLVRDLKMNHIQAWVAARKEGRYFEAMKTMVKWCDSYADLQLRALRTGFKWAVNEGDLISESPFARRGKRVRLGTADMSLKRLAVSEQEFAALVAQADRRKNGSVAALLRILYNTGARPAEVYMATAEEWDPTRQAIVIDTADPRNIGRLKNRRHLRRQGRKRIIRIPNSLLPVMEKLMKDHPEGPLFRTEEGRPWQSADKVAKRFKSLVNTVNMVAAKQGQVPPVRPAVTLYGLRHSYVTRFIKGGGEVMVLCELLNTSLDMIQKHYSHLFDEHDTLLNAVNRFAMPSGSAPFPRTSSTSCSPEQPAA